MLPASCPGISATAASIPGVPMHIEGTVVGKSSEGGENLVELEIRGKNNEGKVTTPGKATVALPSKG